MREGRLSRAVSIAEIVSALAVVATLIYAVSELKRSQAQTSTNIETILYDRMLELDRLLIEAPDLADIVVRAEEQPDNLSPTERRRYLAYEHVFFDAWEAAVEAWKRGLMDQETFDSWDVYFARDAARKPMFAWTDNLRYYNGAFVQYVEERVTWQER